MMQKTLLHFVVFRNKSLATMSSPSPCRCSTLCCASTVGLAGRLSILIALSVVACSKAESSGAPKGRLAPSVVVTKVVTRDVPVEVRAPVDLRPLEQADVGSKVLGYVDAIFVERGDRVKKGQIVALVRPSDLPDRIRPRGLPGRSRWVRETRSRGTDRLWVRPGGHRVP